MNSQMEFLKRMQTNHISLQNSMNRTTMQSTNESTTLWCESETIVCIYVHQSHPSLIWFDKKKTCKIILHILQIALVCDYSNCNFDIAARALIPG